MPAFTGGDATTSAGSGNIAVAKVNGVTYPASPSTDGVPVVTAANTVLYKVVVDCDDTAGQHTNYDTATHAWSCGTSVPTSVRDGVIGGVFDGGGTALTGGTTTARYVTLPVACTIIAWDITVDAGTATFKTWRKATGTAIPTVSDSISTAGVAISSGTAVHSTTVSDWTDTTLDAGDIIGINLSAVATATLATFQITCRK
jgi:hypothetical protein